MPPTVLQWPLKKIGVCVSVCARVCVCLCDACVGMQACVPVCLGDSTVKRDPVCATLDVCNGCAIGTG